MKNYKSLVCTITVLHLFAGLSAVWGGEPPELSAHRLHRAQPDDPGEILRVSEGTFTLTADGRESFMGEDDGVFASLRTDAPNWRFTARVASAPEGSPNPKYGIAVREGLQNWSRGLHMRYDGYENNRCLQWFYRYQVGHGTHHGTRRVYFSGLDREMKQTEGFWLRIERRYPEFFMCRSSDGETWIPVGTERSFSLLPQSLHVGLILTAGGDGRREVSVSFDQVRFEEIQVEDGFTEEMYAPYEPPAPRWEWWVAHTPIEAEGDPQNFFIMKPVDVEWKDIRAFLYSAGSKEVVIQNEEGVLENLRFENGPGNLRKPVDMPEWDGHWVLPPMDPIYHQYAQHGLARVGGAGHPRALGNALKALEEMTGHEGLSRIPFAVSGMSFAGGYTATTARLYPEQTIAAGVTHIGPAGWETDDPRVHKIPHLYISGSHDTTHRTDFLRVSQPVREQGHLWGFATLWWYYHIMGHTQSMVLPYFYRIIDLRLPEDADPVVGPVPLRELNEEDGWLAVLPTWESNHPRVVAWDEATREERRGQSGWFPDEFTARVWSATVSNWPNTVIHFPRFDPNDGWSGRPGGGHIHHQLRAGEPFRILASGPLGEDLKVTWYAGLEPLEVQRVFRDNPYLVEIGGLPAGLHVLHAITETGEGTEISRPHPILVHPAE
ncbi:MAG: hypothetical protein JJU29_09245 [Verrucomicrobia bacterium]|nr:hypothetical protein [Verrucomicrobiota bacterium]MCH8513144.1 hypothetical protein [Kiritimatiellia bacterium]